MSGAPSSVQHGVPSGHGVSRVVILHLNISILHSIKLTLKLHNSEVMPTEESRPDSSAIISSHTGFPLHSKTNPQAASWLERLTRARSLKRPLSASRRPQGPATAGPLCLGAS